MAIDVDEPDFYGTDLLLSDSGDLAVSAAGQLLALDGPLVCGQALLHRLRTARGDLPLHDDYGSTLNETVRGKRAGDPSLVAAAVNAELRSIFEDDPRFLRATDIRAYSDHLDPTRVAVDMRIELAGGDALEAEDVTDPAAAAIELANEDADATVESLDDLPEFDGDEDLADEVPELDEALEGMDFGDNFGEDGTG